MDAVAIEVVDEPAESDEVVGISDIDVVEVSPAPASQAPTTRDITARTEASPGLPAAVLKARRRLSVSILTIQRRRKHSDSSAGKRCDSAPMYRSCASAEQPVPER